MSNLANRQIDYGDEKKGRGERRWRRGRKEDGEREKAKRREWRDRRRKTHCSLFCIFSFIDIYLQLSSCTSSIPSSIWYTEPQCVADSFVTRFNFMWKTCVEEEGKGEDTKGEVAFVLKDGRAEKGEHNIL